MCATGRGIARRGLCVARVPWTLRSAVGSEKLKDTGYGGLPVQTQRTLNDLCSPWGRRPAGFAQLAAGIGRDTKSTGTT